MKVVVSAQGADIDALVDPRFGRAPWLIVTDVETGDWAAYSNSSNVDAAGGAGVQTGTTVASQGVDAVVTGNVGPNAHKVLAAAGIAIHRAGNGVSVRDALEALKRGDLPLVDVPTIAGGWS